MELEHRTTAPAHATGAVEFVSLAAIADDATFRLRDVGDVALLAASIGLRPLPGAGAGGPRYQVVAGFRRLAALRLLARERVLARVHAVLDDDDAWAIALAQALLGEPLGTTELESLRARLSEARVAPWAEELVDEALVRAPVDPELRERFLAFVTGTPAGAGEAYPDDAGDGAEDAEAPDEAERGVTPERAVEVTADELAADLANRMFEVNQDLALAFEAWDELPEEGRRMIIEQARYVAELHPLLAGWRR
jgi:ParB family transcriptional regulator, chromosome partitioning protein